MMIIPGSSSHSPFHVEFCVGAGVTSDGAVVTADYVEFSFIVSVYYVSV